MNTNNRVRILAGRMADARMERERVAIEIEAGRITGISEWNEATKPQPNDIDARDALLLPGFLDIHIHGGVGRNVMEGSQEALDAVSAHLARHGVTGYLATTITGPWEQQAEAVAVAARTMRSQENGVQGAAVLGVHLEGPYINPKKKGAQPGQYVLLPDVEDLTRQLGDNLSALKVVTLAPEMEGALDMIRFLTAKGIVSSIGHTDADYAQMSAGIDVGARHITHCFNAMRPMEGREPGVVGTAMARPELSAELIWDNIHVHPASCRALIAAKGAAGVILISDGIPGAGMEEGYRFDLGDLPVVVYNGSARLPDETLAGSLLTMDTAFLNAKPFTLSERAAMTSYNAALSLGLAYRKGLIAPGYDADLMLFDPGDVVSRTLVAGKTVYAREVSG